MMSICQLCKEASQRSTVKVELCGDHDLTATSKAIKYTNIVKATHASYDFMHTPRRLHVTCAVLHAGVMSDLPMPPTLSQLLQSSNQNILRQSIDLYSMLGQ